MSLDERCRLVRPRPRSTRGSWPDRGHRRRRGRARAATRRDARGRRSCAELKREGASPTAASPSCSRRTERGARKASARRAPGLQARRHLRRRVRDADRLPCTRPFEEECEAAPTDREEDHGPRRRARTASARASSSTTAASTPRSRCARTATRPSWSTATRRPSRPTTTRPDRLYFEPLTLEDVLEIVDVEKPAGVIVQYGGQTPLKLPRATSSAGVPIIGTSPDMIDIAEDRERSRSCCTSSA